MAGKSIQFIGIENVLQAYEYKQVDVWAVFDGRYLIHKGEGREELKQWLMMLLQSGGNPIYTLKVYEDIETADQVKEKTEATGSFGFKLVEDSFLYNKSPYSKTDQELHERLSNIEAKLGAVDEGEEGINIGAIINDYLNNPQKINMLLSGIKNFFSAGPSQPAAVGAIPGPGSATTNPQPLSEQDLNRLSNALDILGAYDAKLPEHLEKLAHLAQSKPGTFKTLLSMLEGM